MHSVDLERVVINLQNSVAWVVSVDRAYSWHDDLNDIDVGHGHRLWGHNFNMVDVSAEKDDDLRLVSDKQR